jgi:hypothetical protein
VLFSGGGHGVSWHGQPSDSGLGSDAPRGAKAGAFAYAGESSADDQVAMLRQPAGKIMIVNRLEDFEHIREQSLV